MGGDGSDMDVEMEMEVEEEADPSPPPHFQPPPMHATAGTFYPFQTPLGFYHQRPLLFGYGPSVMGIGPNMAQQFPYGFSRGPMAHRFPRGMDSGYAVSERTNGTKSSSDASVQPTSAQEIDTGDKHKEEDFPIQEPEIDANAARTSPAKETTPTSTCKRENGDAYSPHDAVEESAKEADPLFTPREVVDFMKSRGYFDQLRSGLKFRLADSGRDDKIRSTVMEHIEMHCRQAGYPSKASAALCRQVTADLRSAVRKARHITDVASSEIRSLLNEGKVDDAEESGPLSIRKRARGAITEYAKHKLAEKETHETNVVDGELTERTRMPSPRTLRSSSSPLHSSSEGSLASSSSSIVSGAQERAVTAPPKRKRPMNASHPLLERALSSSRKGGSASPSPVPIRSSSSASPHHVLEDTSTDDIPGQSTSIVHNNDNWLEQVPTNTETKDPVKRKRPPAPTSLSSSRSMSVQAKARRVDNLSRPIVKPDASPSKDMAERDEKQACSNSTNMSQKRENDTVETSRGDAMQSARTGLTESKRDDDQQTSDNSSPKRVALKSSSMLPADSKERAKRLYADLLGSDSSSSSEEEEEVEEESESDGERETVEGTMEGTAKIRRRPKHDRTNLKRGRKTEEEEANASPPPQEIVRTRTRLFKRSRKYGDDFLY